MFYLHAFQRVIIAGALSLLLWALAYWALMPVNLPVNIAGGM